MNFRKGDIVRCTNANGCHTVHHGLTYKVTGTEGVGCIYLEGREDRYYKSSRFVLERSTEAAEMDGKYFHGLGLESMLSKPVVCTVADNKPIPNSYPAWCGFLAAGGKLKFRSGCDVKFVAYVPDAKPHCQLVLLNPSTGNVVTRYASGKSSTETYDEPGDILVCQ